MPRAPFEGLNVAFPVTQQLSLTGLNLKTLSWRPHEVEKAFQVFQCQEEVYMNLGTDWQYVQEELRKRGIDRPIRARSARSSGDSRPIRNATWSLSGPTTLDGDGTLFTSSRLSLRIKGWWWRPSLTVTISITFRS
jgi:hypothetical protein